LTTGIVVHTTAETIAEAIQNAAEALNRLYRFEPAYGRHLPWRIVSIDAEHHVATMVTRFRILAVDSDSDPGHLSKLAEASGGMEGEIDAR
jgi:hypothetical protein